MFIVFDPEQLEPDGYLGGQTFSTKEEAEARRDYFNAARKPQFRTYVVRELKEI